MSLFPADPPASLQDPASIVHNDWQAFASLDRLSDHWSRPGWHDGSRAYYWMIIPPQKEQLLALAERAQAALLPIGDLDPVPLDWLHLTLHRVGAVDTVNDQQLEAMASEAYERLGSFASFELRVGPLAGSSGAIRFSVSPWDQLMGLYQTVAGIAGRESAPIITPVIKGIRPHISIAYNNRPRPAGPLIRAVEQLRVLPPVTTVIENVHLVELQRQGTTYRWAELAAVPFGR